MKPDDRRTASGHQEIENPSSSAAVSNHARSIVAGTFLAISAVVPAAGIAAEPDTGHEGAVVPDHEEGIDRPSFDPGGDTALPFDAGPPPSGSPGEGSPDEAPVESEPLDDPDARFAPLVQPEASGSGAEEAAPVSPMGGSPPAAPPAPGFAVEAPPPTNDVTPPGLSPSSEPQGLPAEPGSAVGPAAGRLELGSTSRSGAAPRPAPASPGAENVGTPPASPPGEAAAPASAQGAAETAETDSQQPSRGTRFHLVQPGESLWTIAERLLGAEASTARVAHKVAQLWALNRDRIESGDADMIVAGTKLRLR